ncbi:hypothetical protein BT96DRAFT_1080459, partial [Gymnopus androsaceus JB14]
MQAKIMADHPKWTDVVDMYHHLSRLSLSAHSLTGVVRTQTTLRILQALTRTCLNVCSCYQTVFCGMTLVPEGRVWNYGLVL